MEAIPLPNKARVSSLGNNKYSMVLEPLYPGYGITIGNSLRRVLLSSMPGAAVTAVKIKFADHEFSTIPNVKEDVIQIILNLKQLRLKCHSAEPVRISLKEKGEKTVTAASFKETDQVEIVNKDLHIATLDNKNSDLEMEIIVQQGRGYVPVEARDNHHLESGMIALDAIYTPVKSVHFDVSNVRVGQFTNFDKLDLFMETDGSIAGEEVIDIASHILVDHFSMLFNSSFIDAESAKVVVPEQSEAVVQDETEMQKNEVESENEISTSALSTRAKNALLKNHITSFAELKALSSEDISNLSGLGDKTINEILEFLQR